MEDNLTSDHNPPITISYPGDPPAQATPLILLFRVLRKIFGPYCHDGPFFLILHKLWKSISFVSSKKNTMNLYQPHMKSPINDKSLFYVSDIKSMGLGMYDDLKKESEKLYQDTDVEKELAKRKQEGGKFFKIKLNGNMFKNDLQSIFTQFALQPKLLSIAHDYLKVPVRLHSTELHLDNPVTDRPVSSQNWHYDGTDFKMLKVFVYIRPVNEQTGCLGVIDSKLSLHLKSRITRFPKYKKRSLDRQSLVADHVKEKYMHPIYGDEGTVIFADTSLVLHRGYPQISLSRLMYVATYTSNVPFEEWPGSPQRNRYMKIYREEQLLNQ